MRFVRHPLRLLFGAPLFALAAACAAAALAAQAGRVSARWDVLAHFAHVWLACSVVALVAGLAAFRGAMRVATAAVACVGIGAAAALMAPEFLRTTGPVAPAGAPGQIKIVQLNAWTWNLDPVGTVNGLIALNPDIVALEEAPPAVRSLIAARTGWREACASCEVMILSKAPPVSVSVIRHSGLRVTTLTRATYRDRRGLYSVIAVHYPRPTSPAFQQRQERRLARVLAESPRERTIVVGDFNSAPWSFYRRKWDRAFGLIRRDRALFSWPTSRLLGVRWLPPAPLMPIDHVYAGADWATVSVARGPELGSDHYPLILTLAPVGGAVEQARSGP